HSEDGVQCAGWFLKDHGDKLAANTPHVLLAQGCELPAIQSNVTAQRQLFGQKAWNGQASQRLAAATLPNNPENFTSPHLKRNRTHEMMGRVLRRDGNPLEFQHLFLLRYPCVLHLDTCPLH